MTIFINPTATATGNCSALLTIANSWCPPLGVSMQCLAFPAPPSRCLQPRSSHSRHFFHIMARLVGVVGLCTHWDEGSAYWAYKILHYQICQKVSGARVSYTANIRHTGLCRHFVAFMPDRMRQITQPAEKPESSPFRGIIFPAFTKSILLDGQLYYLSVHDLFT